MTRFLATASVALLLAGCSSDTIVSAAYPDRERYSFRDADGEVMTYLCAPGSDAKARAAKAHGYTDAQLSAVSEWAAGHMVNRTASSRQISARIDAVAKKTVEESERRYQCMIADAS